MNALYLKNSGDSEVDSLLDAAARLGCRDVSAAGLRRLFTPDGAAMSMAGDRGVPHSILLPYPRGVFENVVVSPELRLFANAWGAALIWQINGSLRPAGRCVLPYHPSKAAASKGFWSRRWLEERLGPASARSDERGMAVFSRVEGLATPDSVLTWFLHDYGATALDFLTTQFSGVSAPVSALCDDFLLAADRRSPMEPTVQALRPSLEEADRLLDVHFRSMNYSLIGANYKSAVLTRIIDDMLGDRDNLNVLDMGGGAGFVAMELLLTAPRVARAVNCEPMPENLLTALRTFSFFRHRLANRFWMALQKAEEFEYDGSYDVISLLASMMYIPRQHVSHVLARAWEALTSGGLLVVHENIKSPAYTTDFDIMFTVDELEGLLERFGRLDYYLSTAAMRVNRDQVGTRTVFRVLRKP